MERPGKHNIHFGTFRLRLSGAGSVEDASCLRYMYTNAGVKLPLQRHPYDQTCIAQLPGPLADCGLSHACLWDSRCSEILVKISWNGLWQPAHQVQLRKLMR